MKLTDIVDYTGGGVAKKPVIHNNSGICLLLALDKGAVIPTHTANADVLVQILEGICEFTLNGKVHTLGASEYITIAPGEPHSLRAIEKFKVLVTKLNV